MRRCWWLPCLSTLLVAHLRSALTFRAAWPTMRYCSYQGMSVKQRWIAGSSVMTHVPPSILFHSSSLLVIEKPFGVRMDGDFEDTVEKQVKKIVPGKARFIHQLDFATSGALMLGLNKACTARISTCFERGEGEVQKEYIALLEGTLTHEMIVDAPICRYEGPNLLPPRGPPGTHGKNTDFRMMIGEGSSDNPGKESQTCIQPLSHGHYQNRPVTRVLLRPFSGRRHQLRLHTRHVGHEIVGDVTYSSDEERARNCDRMMLHASRIEIPWHDSLEGTLEGGTEGVSWGRLAGDGKRQTVWFQAANPFDQYFAS